MLWAELSQSRGSLLNKVAHTGRLAACALAAVVPNPKLRLRTPITQRAAELAR